jgi:hypothetical protein
VNDTDTFDKWRSGYDELTPEQMSEFYNEMYLRYPEQKSFHLDSVVSCLSGIDDARVFEFGGWDGKLAEMALAQLPNVSAWHNYDCCASAVLKSRSVEDDRYSGVVCSPKCWDDKHPGFNVLVSSHSIEHIRRKELALLIDSLVDLEYVYLDAPLPKRGPTSWSGYFGSHIYEVGWDETISDLSVWGFDHIRSFPTNEGGTAHFMQRLQ